MRTINVTMKIEPELILPFENSLRSQFKVIDLKILPETEKLYEEDETFKKLVKSVKDAQRIRDKYINEHNH